MKRNMPVRESIIESLRGVLNLQILAVEKTLQSLDSHLQTRHQDDIQVIVTSMTRSIHDLMTKMIKSSRSGSRSLLAQTTMKRVRRPMSTGSSGHTWGIAGSSSIVISNQSRHSHIHQSMHTKLDSKRKWAIFADGNAAFRDNLAQPLQSIVHLLQQSHLQSKAMAWKRWTGRNTGVIQTSEAKDYDDDYLDNESNLGQGSVDFYDSSSQHRSHPHNKAKMSTEDFGDHHRHHQQLNYSDDEDDDDPYPMLDEEDLMIHDMDENEEDEQESSSRDESPELFNASSGEPIEINDASGFYANYWLSGGQPIENATTPQSQTKPLPSPSQISSTSASEESKLPSAVDFIRRTSSAEMIASLPSHESPAPILQKKPPLAPESQDTNNKSSKRVTFQDPSLTLLNQLEREMLPLYELSRPDSNHRSAADSLTSSQKFLRNTSFFQPEVILRANYDTLPVDETNQSAGPISDEDMFRVVDSNQGNNSEDYAIGGDAGKDFDYETSDMLQYDNNGPSYQYVRHSSDHVMNAASHLDDEEGLSAGFEMYP